MELRIERKAKGSRVFYFPTVNGMRITKTNFARKYDARNLLKWYVANYGDKMGNPAR